MTRHMVLPPDTIKALDRLVALAAYWLDRAGLGVEADQLRKITTVHDLISLDRVGEAVRRILPTAIRAADRIDWCATTGAERVEAGGGYRALEDVARPFTPGYAIRGRVIAVAAGLYAVAVYAGHAAARGER